MKNRSGIAGYGFRQARTRTLIQLGGLIEKAGLFEAVGLIPGSDLQKDPQMQEIALGLLGAFIEIKRDLQKGEASLELWKLKAQAFLNEASKAPLKFRSEEEKEINTGANIACELL
ncbi:conjugal transfer protein TraD [Candidatus Odyssella thessalonicensis]|uniref:conjugal transfer protein TraD n=1 Tax=Candidatus Odyssella thessalonicensis TaxID=84647 RepID=UPI000225B507|nr:conjugal transfer protein TraD [Candidatus Odyssella thessalonicensis]